jgi:hypothetical protein
VAAADEARLKVLKDAAVELAAQEEHANMELGLSHAARDTFISYQQAWRQLKADEEVTLKEVGSRLLKPTVV